MTTTVDHQRPAQPAATAATRTGAAALALGLLGLACVVLVLARLAASWRVTPHASSHHISLLGARIGYPTANAGAIVIMALALPALASLLLAVVLSGREAAT